MMQAAGNKAAQQQHHDNNMNTVMSGGGGMGGGDFAMHRGVGMQGYNHYGPQPGMMQRYPQQQPQPPPAGMGMMGQHRGGPSYQLKMGQQQQQQQHMGGQYGMMQQPHHHHQMAAQQQQQQQQQQQAPQNHMAYRDRSQQQAIYAQHQHSQQQPFMRSQNSFGDDDRPTSPEDDLAGAYGGYGHDRIQNDLLDEICSDIGIKDAMDLDFLDFDAEGNPFMFSGGQNQSQQQQRGGFSSDLDSGYPGCDGAGDGTAQDPFVQLGSTAQLMARSFTRDSHATDSEKLALRKQDSPYSVQSIPSVNSVKSESNGMAIDSPKVDSPTVSSSSMEEGSGKSNAGSTQTGGSVGSPAVHSTTLCDRPGSTGSVDASVPSPSSKHHRQESSDSTASCPSASLPQHRSTAVMGARSSSVDSNVRSPCPPSGSNPPCSQPPAAINRRHNSVDNLSPKSPFPDHDQTLVPEVPTTPGYLNKKSGFTANLMGSDLKTSFSQPASPAKSKLDAAGMMKAHSLSDSLNRSLASHGTFQQSGENKCEGGFKVPPAPGAGGFPTTGDGRPHKLMMKENQPPRSTDSPCFDGGYYSTGSPSVCTGSSQYGSSTTLSTMSPRVPAPPSSTGGVVKADEHQEEEEFTLTSLPSASDLNIPSLQGDGNSSGASSQPDSPSAIHVAKRPRIISSGTDLLEEMRERYSFVKGASIYDPPSNRSSRAPSQMPSPVRDYTRSQCQDSTQFNFPPAPQHSGGFSGSQGHMDNSMTPSTSGMGQSGYRNMGENFSEQYPSGNSDGSGGQGMYGYNNTRMGPQQGQGMHQQGIHGQQPGMLPGSQGMHGQQQQGMGMPVMGQQPGTPVSQGSGSQQGPMTPMSHQKMYPPGMDSNQPGMGNNGQYSMQQQQGQNQNMWAKQGGNVYNNSRGMPQQQPGGYPAHPSQQQQHYSGQRPGMPQYNMGQYPGPQQGQYPPGTSGQQMGGVGQPQRPPSNPMMAPGMGGPPGPGMGMVGAPGPGPGMGGPSAPLLNSSATFSVNQPLGSQLPPHHQPLLPQDPSKPMTAQQGLMHSIINDRSHAFRNHPLHPLLRDLIIADMNFHTPSFPFQLIANLPGDFDKLLMNYQNRNPINRNYPVNQAVDKVIMDALRYAHQSLIEKIQVKKHEVGYQEPAKPLTAIEDFCERFDRAVKNSMTEPSGPTYPDKSGPGSAGYRPGGSLPSTPSKVKTEPSDKPKTTATAGRNKVLPKESEPSKQKVKGPLSNQAVQAMLEWLREHQDNPYPNDDEKEMLINKTKLTINQINYWFTNARRRILPKWALQRYMEQQQQRAGGGGPPFGARMTAT